jgi:hypothetical protein
MVIHPIVYHVMSYHECLFLPFIPTCSPVPHILVINVFDCAFVSRPTILYHAHHPSIVLSYFVQLQFYQQIRYLLCLNVVALASLSSLVGIRSNCCVGEATRSGAWLHSRPHQHRNIVDVINVNNQDTIMIMVYCISDSWLVSSCSP